MMVVVVMVAVVVKGKQASKQGEVVDGTTRGNMCEPMNATLFPGNGSDACTGGGGRKTRQ